jgi:hypothetical protein
MLAVYERTRGFQHRPSKGSVRETEVLDQFLTPYMPQNVKTVRSSEVASLDEERSAQMDLLIADPTAPFLLAADDYRVLAAETVFGVIEVKSYLSAAQLKSAYGKIAKFKAMRRTAYHQPLRFTQTRTAYGRVWDTFPPVGIIFGYDGDGMVSLGNAMAEVAERYEDEPHLQVDSIWVLRKGSLTWADPVTRNINVCPEPGDFFRALDANPGEVLLHLTAHLHEYFARAWTPGFRILDYVGKAPFGKDLQAWGPSALQA